MFRLIHCCYRRTCSLYRRKNIHTDHYFIRCSPVEEYVALKKFLITANVSSGSKWRKISSAWSQNIQLCLYNATISIQTLRTMSCWNKFSPSSTVQFSSVGHAWDQNTHYRCVFPLAALPSPGGRGSLTAWCHRNTIQCIPEKKQTEGKQWRTSSFPVAFCQHVYCTKQNKIVFENGLHATRRNTS